MVPIMVAIKADNMATLTVIQMIFKIFGSENSRSYHLNEKPVQLAITLLSLKE
jgi:hypothetical protein